jgi:hypothetical protein
MNLIQSYKNKNNLSNNDNDEPLNNFKNTTKFKTYKNNRNENSLDIDNIEPKNIKTSHKKMKKYKTEDIPDNSISYEDNLLKEEPNEISLAIKNSIRNYNREKNSKEIPDQSGNNYEKKNSKDFINYISNQDYNNSKYEKKLSDIAKMKEDLMNEDNNKAILKKNKNPKRTSILDIMRRKGLLTKLTNSKNKENLNTEPNEPNKIKNNLYKMQKNNRNNKSDNDESESDEEEDEVKRNEEGVNYINFRLDLKKIYKKPKWKLTPAKEASIFIKAKEINNRNKKKKNGRIIFNVGEKKKYNKTRVDNLYKVKGDNQKIIDNKKLKNNFNKFTKNKEEDENSETNINGNDGKKDNNNENESKFNSSTKLFFDLLYNKNEENEKRNNLHDKNNEKNGNNRKFSEENKYNQQNKHRNTFDYYFINKFERRAKKNNTVEENENRNLNLEDFVENLKSISKVRGKKAKIKKFITNKEDIDNYSKRRKKNLNDYFNKLSRNNADNDHHHVCKRYKNTFIKNNTDKRTVNRGNRRNRTEIRQVEFNSSQSSIGELDDDVDYEGEEEEGKNERNISHKYTKTSQNRNFKKFDKNIGRQKKKFESFNTNPLKRPLNNRLNQSAIKNRKNMNVPKIDISLIKNNKYYANKLPSRKDSDSKKETNHGKFKSVPKMSLNNSYQNKRRDNMKGMKDMDPIKSQLKIFNGPIDLSCVSFNNYEETVDNLINKFKKDGYIIIRNGNNSFEFSNGKINYLVEIVNIRNNTLYYLINKIK